MTLTIAIPKGRIAEELLPRLAEAGIVPEDAFFDKASRKLRFATNKADIQLIRVRSFDVATYVSYGGADIGIVGKDVLMEMGEDNLYIPLDLGIGACRMCIAAPDELANMNTLLQESHVRIATKYVQVTKDYFASHGIQAECIKLNGAMELAPKTGLSDYIVDLVSTGNTLKANGLKEIATIADITSHVVVNQVSYKTKRTALDEIIQALKA